MPIYWNILKITSDFTKQNKLHLKIKLKLFFIFFQKREASQEKILKYPNINFKVVHWTDLIDLSVNGVSKPPLTLDFSDDELQNSLLTGEKINLPDFPSHSQGGERAVKLVTETSQYVYGFEARY